MTLQDQAELQVQGSARFRDRLLAIMDRKDHPSYWRLMGPGTSRAQLLVHYQQEWVVYVRDFPQLLSCVHARCPEADVRYELAENLFEEETGKISGGGPHNQLFLHMMEGLGFRRRAFERPALLPESVAYRAFLDRATQEAPWQVGLAVATIFVEGSRNDRAEIGTVHPGVAGEGRVRANPLARDPLVVNHGLHPRFLKLKRVHRKVEGSHRVSAWRSVLAHSGTRAERAQVEAALERALTLWIAYRDGVARAARLD